MGPLPHWYMELAFKIFVVNKNSQELYGIIWGHYPQSQSRKKVPLH